MGEAAHPLRLGALPGDELEDEQRAAPQGHGEAPGGVERHALAVEREARTQRSQPVAVLARSPSRGELSTSRVTELSKTMSILFMRPPGASTPRASIATADQT